MVFQVGPLPINIARIFSNYNPSHGLHLRPKLLGSFQAAVLLPVNVSKGLLRTYQII
jgi:hypothetical protein